MLDIPVLKFEKSCNYLENQLQLQNEYKERVLDFISSVSEQPTKIKSNCYANIIEDANKVLDTISNNISSIEKMNLDLKTITGELNNVLVNQNKSTKTKDYYINTFSSLKNNLIVYSKNFQQFETKLTIDNKYFNEFINKTTVDYSEDFYEDTISEDAVSENEEIENISDDAVSENEEIATISENEEIENVSEDVVSENEEIATISENEEIEKVSEDVVSENEEIATVSEDAISENEEIATVSENEKLENISEDAVSETDEAQNYLVSDFSINNHVIEKFNNTTSFGYDDIEYSEIGEATPIFDTSSESTINIELDSTSLSNRLNDLNSGEVLLVSFSEINDLSKLPDISSLKESSHTSLVENIELEEEFIEEILALENFIKEQLLDEVSNMEEVQNLEELDLDKSSPEIPESNNNELENNSNIQTTDEDLIDFLEDNLLEDFIDVQDIEDSILEDNVNVVDNTNTAIDIQEEILTEANLDVIEKINSLDELDKITSFKDKVKEEVSEELLSESLLKEIDNLDDFENNIPTTSSVEETTEEILEEIDNLDSIETNSSTSSPAEETTEEILEKIDNLDNIETNSSTSSPLEETVEEILEETPENLSILDKIDALEEIEPQAIENNENTNKKPSIKKARIKNNKHPLTKEDYFEKIEEITNATCDNKTLIISESMQKVYLPYKKLELLNYIEKYPDYYKSFSDVVEKEFILPFDFFKNQSSKARFSETYNLLKNRDGQSFIKSVSYAFKVLGKKNLNPTIIASCKTRHELESYIYYLDANNLNNFRFFDIIYEVNPTKKHH